MKFTDILQYVSFEARECIDLQDYDAIESYPIGSTLESPDFWGVYGWTKKGITKHIIDVCSPREAEDLVELFTEIINQCPSHTISKPPTTKAVDLEPQKRSTSRKPFVATDNHLIA